MSMTTRHQHAAHMSQQSVDKENEALPFAGETATEEVNTIDNSQTDVSPAKTHAQSALPAPSYGNPRSGPGRFAAVDNKRKRQADSRRDSGASSKRQQVHGPAFDKDKQSLSAHTSTLSVEDIEGMFEKALSRSVPGSPNVKSQASGFRAMMPLITAHSKRSEDQKQIAVALAAIKHKFEVRDYDDLKVQSRDSAVRREISAWLSKDGHAHNAGVTAILDILDKNASTPTSPAKCVPPTCGATSPSPFAIVVPLHPSARKSSHRKSPGHAKQQLHFTSTPVLEPKATQAAGNEQPAAELPVESCKPLLEKSVTAEVGAEGPANVKPICIDTEKVPIVAADQGFEKADDDVVGKDAPDAAPLAPTAVDMAVDSSVVSPSVDAAAGAAGAAFEGSEDCKAAEVIAEASPDAEKVHVGEAGAVKEPDAPADADANGVVEADDDVKMGESGGEAADGVKPDSGIDGAARGEASVEADATDNVDNISAKEEAAQEVEASGQAVVVDITREAAGSGDQVMQDAAAEEEAAVEQDTGMPEAVAAATVAEVAVMQVQDAEASHDAVTGGVDAKVAGKDASSAAPDDAMVHASETLVVGKEDAPVAPDVGMDHSAEAPEVDKKDASAAPEVGKEDASVDAGVGKEDASVDAGVGKEDASVAPGVGKEFASAAPEVGTKDASAAGINTEGTQVVSTGEEPQSQPDAITKDEDAEETSRFKEDQARASSASAAMMTPPTATKMADSTVVGAGVGQEFSRMMDFSATEDKEPKMGSSVSSMARIEDPFAAQKMHELNELESQYVSACEDVGEKKRLEEEALAKHQELQMSLLQVQKEYHEAQTNLKNARRHRMVAEMIANEHHQELKQGMQGLGNLMSSFEQEKSRMGQLAAKIAQSNKPSV